MSSNSLYSQQNLPPNFRPTFGILDLQGNIYKDIIRSFLIAQRVTIEEWQRGYIFEPTKKRGGSSKFVIHCDTKTLETLTRDNAADCIISFQVRKTGRFALIRLFDKELKNVNRLKEKEVQS